MGNVPNTIVKKVKRSRELEKYTKPTGLYENCPYDERTVKRWVLNGTLAPIYPGSDHPSDSTEECPICFMHYKAINRSTCCKKTMCTECYLQVKPPRTSPDCPFCNSTKFAMKYVGALSEEERELIRVEEQKMIEAKIRMKQEQEKEEEEKRKQQALNPSTNPPPQTESAPAVAEARDREKSDEVQIPLASSNDRRKLEEELKRIHRTESGSVYDSPFQQGSARRRGSGGNSWEDDFFSALGSDTSSVEEMMLREALRRSKLEHDFREVGRAANAGNSNRSSDPLPRSPLPPNAATTNDEGYHPARMSRVPPAMRNSRGVLRPAALQPEEFGDSTSSVWPPTALQGPPSPRSGFNERRPPTPPRRSPRRNQQPPDIARAAAEEIGMGYEEQLKLAIALSLQDTPETQKISASESGGAGEATEDDNHYQSLASLTPQPSTHSPPGGGKISEDLPASPPLSMMVAAPAPPMLPARPPLDSSRTPTDVNLLAHYNDAVLPEIPLLPEAVRDNGAGIFPSTNSAHQGAEEATLEQLDRTEIDTGANDEDDIAFLGRLEQALTESLADSQSQTVSPDETTTLDQNMDQTLQLITEMQSALNTALNFNVEDSGPTEFADQLIANIIEREVSGNDRSPDSSSRGSDTSRSSDSSGEILQSHNGEETSESNTSTIEMNIPAENIWDEV